MTNGGFESSRAGNFSANAAGSRDRKVSSSARCRSACRQRSHRVAGGTALSPYCIPSFPTGGDI